MDLVFQTYKAFLVKTQADFERAVGRFIEIYGKPPLFALCRRPSDFRSLPHVQLIHYPLLPPSDMWLGNDKPPITTPAMIEGKDSNEAQHSAPIVSPPESIIPPRQGKGRPPTHVTCPFCYSKARPESLGYWGGWTEGNAPPYWEQLRLYVFQRDGFKCRQCRQVFPADKLVAHHVIPKEQHGEDSARNLVTYCIYHHPF